MTAATTTPSSTRCSPRRTTPRLVAERDRLRGQGLLAGIGIAACLEPSGANSTFEPLLNPKNETTTYTRGLPHQCRCQRRRHRDHSYALGRAGTRDPGRHRDRRGAGDRSRPHPRRAPGLAVVVAEPEPGRQPHGDHDGRRRVPRRAKAEGPDRRHCRAQPRHPSGARDLRRGRRVRPRRAAEPPELERARHHRAPQLPSPAARHRTGARLHPRDAGADRGTAADRRRPRADVSLLRVRVPSHSGRRSIPISASPRSGATSSATTAAP